MKCQDMLSEENLCKLIKLYGESEGNRLFNVANKAGKEKVLCALQYEIEISTPIGCSSSMTAIRMSYNLNDKFIDIVIALIEERKNPISQRLKLERITEQMRVVTGCGSSLVSFFLSIIIISIYGILFSFHYGLIYLVIPIIFVLIRQYFIMAYSYKNPLPELRYKKEDKQTPS